MAPAAIGPTSAAADQTMLSRAATAVSEIPARRAPTTPSGNVMVNISAEIGPRASRNPITAWELVLAATSSRATAIAGALRHATRTLAARSPKRATTALEAMKVRAATEKTRPMVDAESPFRCSWSGASRLTAPPTNPPSIIVSRLASTRRSPATRRMVVTSGTVVSGRCPVVAGMVSMPAKTAAVRMAQATKGAAVP
jgi:hypothetical protein